MKTTVDTSVIVASFASWHEHHAIASAAVGKLDVVVAHCLLETYSVLTRLPAPHRMAPEVVSNYLHLAFGSRAVVGLSAPEQRRLVQTCCSLGLAGGAIYDAVIAATCAAEKVKLLTLDARARATYVAIGVDHTILA